MYNKKFKEIPKWVINAPPTPLEEILQGKRYPHLLVCSGDWRKPLGSPGCICLRILKEK
jgi:hypothetical protein